MTAREPNRAVALAPLSFLGAFAALAIAGGAANPGYSHVEDILSALASYGAASPWLGASALLALAGAHLATAYAIRRSAALAFVPGALAVGGGAIVAAAFFRLHCANGPVGCYVRESAGSAFLTDVVHARAVAIYQVALTLAMGGLAWKVARAKELRWLAAASVGAALLSFSILTFMGMGGGPQGIAQRAWIFVNSLWLVASAFALTRPVPSADAPRALPSADASMGGAS